MSKEIRISPVFDPWYYEYYLKGLFDFYKGYKISFDYSGEYTSLAKYARTPFRKDFFFYTIHENNKTVKVVIGADDKCEVNEELYRWADIYAKVNIDNDSLQQYPHLFPIGPNFGIRYFSLLRYLLFSARLFMKTGIRNPYLRSFMKLSLKRSYDKDYQTSGKDTQGNFVFYINYPWKKHSDVTEKRKTIIGILQTLHLKKIIRFEGGFSRKRSGTFEGLEDYSATRRYSHKQYLEKLKQSAIAINTPAVHNCIGWKMGEYLALGKPVISTPLNRILPDGFADGIHYKEISDINQDLEAAITSLINDDELRNRLSHNARSYYENYLSPVKVIERIHKRVMSYE